MKITALFVFILAVSNLTHAQKADEILAQIGSKKITTSYFNEKYTQVKSQVMNPPSKKDFLEDLIRYEVGLQEAEKKKLINDPLVIEMINQAIYKTYVEKELSAKVDKIQVSDKEMKDWYVKNPEIKVSHILIEIKSGANAEQKSEALKRAKEILDEVKKSKRPFEELVKLYSDDVYSKEFGGQIGWISRTTVVPNFYNTAINLKVGEISDLIETPYGLHIIKILERNSYEMSNKKTIRFAVFDEKRKILFNDLFTQLKKSYSIKVNENLLK